MCPHCGGKLVKTADPPYPNFTLYKCSACGKSAVKVKEKK